MSKKFTAPKRRIERIRNRIDTLMTASLAAIILHAAEDAKTLVRTIIDLNFTFISATPGETEWGTMISRAENSQLVINPVVSQVLDNAAPIALIWENSGTLRMVDATGAAPRMDVFADIKGMRKMKENDTIEMTNIASTASVIRVVGTITLFFKE